MAIRPIAANLKWNFVFIQLICWESIFNHLFEFRCMPKLCVPHSSLNSHSIKWSINLFLRNESGSILKGENSQISHLLLRYMFSYKTDTIHLLGELPLRLEYWCFLLSQELSGWGWKYKIVHFPPLKMCLLNLLLTQRKQNWTKPIMWKLCLFFTFWDTPSHTMHTITNSDLNRPCFAWHPYGKSGLFKTELVIVHVMY